MKSKFIPPVIFISSAFFVFIIFFTLTVDEKNHRSNNFFKQMPSTSGAYEALTFWSNARSYPGEHINSKKYEKEFEKEKTILRKNHSITETGGWESMGPENVPGRMISLAVNPQNSKTLYAGSASGGLWRTYNSATGENWHRITTGFPVLGVMAIAIDPLDTNTIYIGTGEVYGYQSSVGSVAVRLTRGSYGIGILKSTDGGDTWSKSLDWSIDEEKGIQDLVINPQNSSSIYAATSEGIYKSVNAGESWNLIHNVLMVQDIIVHPIDTNKVLASCGNLGSTGTGVYRSTNAGESWNKVSGIPNYSGKTLIDVFQADPDIVFASVANSESSIGLYKTRNFGESWFVVHNEDVQRYQGFFSHWVAVHPTDETQVVHAGVNIYKSNSGGAVLQQIGGPHVDHHNYAHDPFNPDVLFIANDGGVYRSTNFGNSYTSIGQGLITAQFYNGFSSSRTDTNFAIGGLQDNNSVIYTGDKTNWPRVIGGDGSWAAINPIDDNIVFGSSQHNNIYKSNNRGLSFSNSTSGMIDAVSAFIAPYAIAESNTDVMFSGRRIVYKSTNQGDGWFETASTGNLGNPAISISISAKDEGIVYVGYAPIQSRAQIYKTSNGGGNWFDVTENLPDRYPMDIAIDPSDKNTVYVVFAGFGSGHVFKSINAGASWSDITHDLPDVPTTSVVVDPISSDNVYVGNDLGVYASSDAGDSWINYSEGLPEAVMAMDLNVSAANRKLRVATHGNGAYQRPLLGVTNFSLTATPKSITGTLIQGTELSFYLMLNNFGSLPQTENAEFILTVLDESSSELYKERKSYCCLDAGSSYKLEFDGVVSFENPGRYKIQYVRFANAQLAVPDTISQSFNVIGLPQIAESKVVKITRAYRELSDATILGAGDDIQHRIILPFNFAYDGRNYSKIQISSNGWLEFGIGTDGSEFGLSTPTQIGNIGANENGRLGGTSRPSKALGPWWEDLNANSSGNLSYKTEGNAPNRVFTFQWKNILAYYDQSTTTTRVNFQVRLYETSNKIEFCYGKVIPGTFAGGDIGAMIGFKDHIGGDYHFYDIAAGGPGTQATLVTNLSPLTDWPGDGQVYVIANVSTTIDDVPITVPGDYVLEQNYPNPFNPVTIIRYGIPIRDSNSGNVTLKIFDSIGREVAKLINENQAANFYEIEWNAAGFASGVYFYSLQAGNKQITKKMLLLK
jgi:photosystem II stability/assembly factor-like uncharacterized protein